MRYWPPWAFFHTVITHVLLFFIALLLTMEVWPRDLLMAMLIIPGFIAVTDIVVSWFNHHRLESVASSVFSAVLFVVVIDGGAVFAIARGATGWWYVSMWACVIALHIVYWTVVEPWFQERFSHLHFQHLRGG